MSSGNCVICNSNESTPCSRCGVVFYCGKDHQKKHWNEHRVNCKLYRISVSDKMGRHMVAARDIKAGELILKESPLVVGPRINTSLLCLGCFRVLSKNYKLCQKCGLAPVCGANCELKSPHADYECEFYRRYSGENFKNDFVISNLQLVMPLKCLAFKTFPDYHDLWHNFVKLESHVEERKNDPIWKYYEKKVIEVREGFNSSHCSMKVLYSAGFLNKNDFLTIQKICGILDVNCFELRGPIDANLTRKEHLRGIYPEAAFMSHDCIGNTHVSVDDYYEMSVHASQTIKAGELILFNYCNPLENTFDRLQRLKVGKYFNCTCRRCSDPTELGTYMGSINCSKCHSGCVVPADPISPSSKWHCEKCRHEFHSRLIRTTIAVGRSLVEDCDFTDTKELENFLAKCSKSFPQTSVVLIEIKQKLYGALRDEILREISPKKSTLKRAVELCQESLNLLEIIEPGISRLKGITLYELYKPKLFLARKALDSCDITSEKFLHELLDCEKNLKDAISMLVYEPNESPEGRLFKVALNELKELRDDIRNFCVLNQIN